jgi:Fe-S cluster assembly protein SufD
MTAVTTAPIQYRDAKDALASLADRRADSGPPWLASARRAAALRFREDGLPTLKHEEWRFTNIRAIAETAFVPAEEAEATLSSDDVRRFAFPGLDADTLVFVNGRFASELSSMPDGVTVELLSEALATRRELIEPLLRRVAERDDNGFAWLNSAILEDGVFIHVKRNQIVERPISLLHVAVPGAVPGAGVPGPGGPGLGAPFMTHPRNVVVVEDGAQATVIERYVAAGEGVYFNNAVTQIDAGDNTHVAHYLLEQESTRAFNINTLHVRQGRGSNVDSHSILLGGALVRNNVYPTLDGEHAECLINGLFVGTGTQHLDNFMHVTHAKPHGDSRQFYQGVLNDKARGVFRGRIVVEKDAQKTDAKQTSANLLLSDTAEIDTKPQLEIYADDVKCTHGATIGQIDEDAIFYLRSRGIDNDAARAMMVFAFASQSLDRMKLAPLREALTQELLKQLPQGDFIAQVL